MFLAIPTGLAQIYGSDSVLSGCLILAGVLLASPLFFIHAVMAAVISIFTGEHLQYIHSLAIILEIFYYYR